CKSGRGAPRRPADSTGVDSGQAANPWGRRQVLRYGGFGMMNQGGPLIAVVGQLLEAAAVLVIVIGFLFATVRYLDQLRAGEMDAFRNYRRGLGRTLLLGIEVLIAGDLVRTVAVHPSLEHVLALAVIVLLRTFLSISIRVGLEGRWPWQRPDQLS